MSLRAKRTILWSIRRGVTDGIRATPSRSGCGANFIGDDESLRGVNVIPQANPTLAVTWSDAGTYMLTFALYDTTRFVVERLIGHTVKRAHVRVVLAWVTCREVFT